MAELILRPFLGTNVTELTLSYCNISELAEWFETFSSLRAKNFPQTHTNLELWSLLLKTHFPQTVLSPPHNMCHKIETYAHDYVTCLIMTRYLTMDHFIATQTLIKNNSLNMNLLFSLSGRVPILPLLGAITAPVRQQIQRMSWTHWLLMFIYGIWKMRYIIFLMYVWRRYCRKLLWQTVSRLLSVVF